MFLMAIVKLSVLLHPGGPTIISGIFASMHATVSNKVLQEGVCGRNTLEELCVLVQFMPTSQNVQ